MKTRVYIITGFLGSGKTTLIQQILKFSTDLSKTVVLVNEFGKIGIDGSLIKHTAAADIVELSSGCICCSLKTDLIQTLQIINHRYSPERLVIEATGVADPLAIKEALDDRMLAPHFQLEKIITVVDYDFWEAREVFGTVFESQITHADILLLNKIDTLNRSDIPIVLKQIQAESEKGVVIPTLHCNIDPDIIWTPLEPHRPIAAKIDFLTPYDPQTDFYSGAGKKSMTAEQAGFMTFTFETAMPLDREKFKTFLNTVPLELFRIKGPVRFDKGTQMLNFVGGNCQWQKWADTADTCLAFIGWNVIEELMLEKLNQCIIRI